MSIIIRNMLENDLNDVKSLNEATLPENYPMWIWINEFVKAKDFSFVALDNNKIVGYILCNKEYIVSFAVSNKYRGQGIGSKLLKMCIGKLKNNVKLQVRVNNSVAIKLYQKNGFEIKKTLPNYYMNPVEDAYLMEYKYLN